MSLPTFRGKLVSPSSGQEAKRRNDADMRKENTGTAVLGEPRKTEAK
jgi:hypothetical protein